MTKHTVIPYPLSAVAAKELVLHIDRIADELDSRGLGEFKEELTMDDDCNYELHIALQVIGYRLYDIGKTAEGKLENE